MNKRNFKHGDSVGYKVRLYRVWHGMRMRCHNKDTPSYKWYGAHGICVCEQWRDYRVFAKWARENGYSDDLQIDRIDTHGDYSPENCRFVTPRVNARNKRDPNFFKFGVREKKSGRFASQIRIKNKCIHLGTFDSFEEAKQAYLKADTLPTV